MSFFHVRETKVDNKWCGQIEPAYLFSAMVDELPHCLCHVSLSFPTLYEMLQFNTLGSCFHPHHFYPQGSSSPSSNIAVKIFSKTERGVEGQGKRDNIIQPMTNLLYKVS